MIRNFISGRLASSVPAVRSSAADIALAKPLRGMRVLGETAAR
jgi:hypothetical protein